MHGDCDDSTMTPQRDAPRLQSVLTRDCRAEVGRALTSGMSLLCDSSGDAGRQCTGNQMRMPPFPLPPFKNWPKVLRVPCLQKCVVKFDLKVD